ncbi:MAG: cadherin-like beta sandwich domain-containing protein [Marinilabiliaceae bacterium]|nr:cadherin-like beta sandwich domain-containing protein [Marinilabiliaceae bacterium]
MKRKSLRLKIWGLLLLGGLISSNVTKAQTDVTSTYIKNPGFDISCKYVFDAVASNLGTSDNGTTIDSISEWIGKYEGWSAGSSFEYGTEVTLNGNTIPTTDPSGNSGTGQGTLGVCAAWGGKAYYEQNVTLPAGTYILKYKVQNFGPSTAGNSIVGFVPDAGQASLSSITTTEIGSWISDSITIVLGAETSGKIQVGIASPGSGSNGNGRFAFDNLQLLYSNLSGDANLSSLTVDAGNLVPAFNPDITSYMVMFPADSSTINVTASASHPNASITGDGAIDVSSVGTATITVTAENNNTKTYVITFAEATDNLIELWDGNGITGNGSKPNEVGWLNTVSSSIPWAVANSGGGCRFRDYNVAGGYTGYINETDSSIVDTRQLMLRFDNNSYSSSVYSYPVYLESCTAYTFTWDYVCGGSATPPQTMTVGISTTPDANGRLSSKVFTSTSSATEYRNGSYNFNSGDEGVYYITINGDFGWFGVNNLSITTNTNEYLTISDNSLSFDEINVKKSFVIAGNALSNDVTLSSPIGIALSTKSITKENVQCGVIVTATFDAVKNIDDTIFISSGIFADTILVNASVPVQKKRIIFVTPSSASRDTAVIKEINAFGNDTVYKVVVLPKSIITIDDVPFLNTADVVIMGRNIGSSDIGSGMEAWDEITAPVLSTNMYGLRGLENKAWWTPINSAADIATNADTILKAKILVSDDPVFEGITDSVINWWSGMFSIFGEDTQNNAAGNGMLLAKSVDNRPLFIRWAKDVEFYPGAGHSPKGDRSYIGNGNDKTQINYFGFTDASKNVFFNELARLASGIATVIPSSDATLSGLVADIGVLTPNFSSDVTEYAVDAPYGTQTVTITATANDTSAKVSGDGAIDVSSGTGIATIIVEAENGTEKTYTVTITVGPNSVPNTEINIVGVYPTVSSTNFTVKSKIGCVIEVYSLTGKTVKKLTSSSTEQIISVEQPGIYLIKVDGKLFKVVKKN